MNIDWMIVAIAIAFVAAVIWSRVENEIDRRVERARNNMLMRR